MFELETETFEFLFRFKITQKSLGIINKYLNVKYVCVCTVHCAFDRSSLNYGHKKKRNIIENGTRDIGHTLLNEYLRNHNSLYLVV